MAKSAKTANTGRVASPTPLKILNGQGVRKDGVPTDSGGRPISAGPDFNRGVPEKPAHLSDDAAWLWDKVVQQMSTVGLLKPLDGPSLEVMAETFGKWREAVRMIKEYGLTHTNSQGVTAAPWVGVEERAAREFRAWCAEYGITPAAEANLKHDSGALSGGADDVF